MKTIIVILFAVLVSAIALGISAVGGHYRGGAPIDQALFVGFSVAFCLGGQLILGLTRLKVRWLILVICLLGTLFCHITFFSYASLRAADFRSQHSVQRASIERQIEVTRQALAAINARSATTIAGELSIAKGWRKRSALVIELSESKRAVILQDNLMKLVGTESVTDVTGATDLVTSYVASVTGGSTGSISLVTNVFFSIGLEVLGAFLWYVVLQRRVTDIQDAQQVSANQSKIGELEKAVKSGMIKPTVRAIRFFLSCGQADAMEVRRTLRAKLGIL